MGFANVDTVDPDGDVSVKGVCVNSAVDLQGAVRQLYQMEK